MTRPCLRVILVLSSKMILLRPRVICRSLPCFRLRCPTGKRASAPLGLKTSMMYCPSRCRDARAIPAAGWNARRRARRSSVRSTVRSTVSRKECGTERDGQCRLPDDHVCALAIVGEADFLFSFDRGYRGKGLAAHGVNVLSRTRFCQPRSTTSPGVANSGEPLRVSCTPHNGAITGGSSARTQPSMTVVTLPRRLSVILALASRWSPDGVNCASADTLASRTSSSVTRRRGPATTVSPRRTIALTESDGLRILVGTDGEALALHG